MCDENTYVVCRCRRGDWYIMLRNVGKIERQYHVISTWPSWKLLLGIVDVLCVW